MRIIEQFFSLLAPDECQVCEREGSLLCEDCAAETLIRLPERCYRCYKQSELSKTCQNCRKYSVLKYVWVGCEYNRSAKKLIYSLKFNFAKSAAKVIAREIAIALPALPEDTVIVHIPAATSHVRKRGFDQSALVARELSLRLNLPHIHALARMGQQRQVGSKRAERLEQMKNAFRPVSGAIKHMNVLLVDDVLTTGSTLESAALTLKKASAKTIAAAVFAQAQ